MVTDDWDQLAASARRMSAATDVQSTLARAVEAAVEHVDGCEHAGISIVHSKASVSTEAASSDVARLSDELQHLLREGPSLQAIYDEETVESKDLEHEERWPTWSKRVVEEAGIRSMLCLQLFVVADETVGCLGLYSSRPRAFTLEHRHVALALAAQVAIAHVSALQQEQMDLAVTNRTVIGQAQGMLMQRYDLTAEQAFAVLVRKSQAENRRLHAIAVSMVADGPLL